MGQELADELRREANPGRAVVEAVALVTHIPPRILRAYALRRAVVDASVNAVAPPFAALQIDPDLVTVFRHSRNERNNLTGLCAASDQQWGHQERGRGEAKAEYCILH